VRLLSLRVDLDLGLGHVRIREADQPGCVVDLRGHVQDDAAGVRHALSQRIREVIGRSLALPLPCLNSLAGDGVVLHPLRVFVLARDVLELLGRDLDAGDVGRGHDGRSGPLRLGDRITLLVLMPPRQVSVAPCIGGLPLLDVLNCLKRHNPRHVGLQRNLHRSRRHPVVHVPLRVLQVADHALAVKLAVDDGLLTNHADDRDVLLARDFPVIDDLVAEYLVPANLGARDRALLRAGVGKDLLQGCPCP
jgi:hypothetical protein